MTVDVQPAMVFQQKPQKIGIVSLQAYLSEVYTSVQLFFLPFRLHKFTLKQTVSALIAVS
jgi:hypothetical protein